MTEFAGRWSTTFGPMQLIQNGDRVRGTYVSRGAECSLVGRVEDGRLVFRYAEPAEQGEGWFVLPRYGRFEGQWRRDGVAEWGAWDGSRGWDGVWETTFGRLRLVQEPERVFGFYEGAGPSRVEGHIDGDRLVFRYEEPAARGTGWFEMDDSAGAFHGEWSADGRLAAAAWDGRRVHAMPGLIWLVVLETHWQRSLGDGEYAYGNMLREFFARLPHVAVRHRFFNDETSLARWCRELLYLAEPAVVSIASHGTPAGLTVHGQTIDTRLVIDNLRHADSVSLLHFSACLVLHEGEDGDFARRVAHDLPFPVSGYTTSVDWGGSAVIEFGYFDMIFSKGLTPEDAARQLPHLIAYAGDDELPGSPYAPLGFRFFPGGAVSAPIRPAGAE